MQQEYHLFTFPSCLGHSYFRNRMGCYLQWYRAVHWGTQSALWTFAQVAFVRWKLRREVEKGKLLWLQQRWREVRAYCLLTQKGEQSWFFCLLLQRSCEIEVQQIILLNPSRCLRLVELTLFSRRGLSPPGGFHLAEGAQWIISTRSPVPVGVRCWCLWFLLLSLLFPLLEIALTWGYFYMFSNKVLHRAFSSLVCNYVFCILFILDTCSFFSFLPLRLVLPSSRSAFL